MVAAFVAWLRSRKYRTPRLHEGTWDILYVNHLLVKWRRLEPPPSCNGSEHRAMECSITHDMTHVDVCICGSKRYGVWGAWS